MPVLLALVGLHAVLAVVVAALARALGRRVFLVAAIAPAATTAYAASQAPRILEGEAVVGALTWVPSLGLDLVLRLDAFGLLMVGLVSGIGVGVFVYAYGYFTTPYPKLGSFAGALTAFSGSMLGLVLAENLLVLFVFWELTSITSFLLIGFEDRKAAAKAAAQQALLTTGLGGLALLGGILLIGQATGTTSLSELSAMSVTESPVLAAGLLLALLGAFTKSAHVPFHTWLPGAMAAPTPVSAYLHSATMVKAGVYLVARLAPIFADVGLWRAVVVGVGLATMLLGAYRALRQHDLKLLLAFGTVSQLGFLVVLFGLGYPKATFAATVLILAHALFKAALFMVVGIIDKVVHTRDLRRLAGLRTVMPGVLVAGTITAASMAGLPPIFGFIAKEAAYEGLLQAQSSLGPVALIAIIGIITGSMLTFAYSARFVAGIWGLGVEQASAGGDPRVSDPVEPPVDLAGVTRPALVFTAPALVLAGLSVVLGLLPLVADEAVNAAAVALDPRWEEAHLALWHGFNLALALSGLTVAVGGGLFLARRRVTAVQDRIPALPDAKAGYEGTVRGLLTVATRLTGVVQHGSLPLYLAVILLVVAAIPALALGQAVLPSGGIPFAAGPGQVVVGLAVIVAAVATPFVGRRFAAVLLLGAVGYGVAILFVLHGAPDLALTQLLIETLGVVLFVLVLRHLPDRFDERRRASLPGQRTARAVVAGFVGLVVAGFTLAATASRTAAPVSDDFLARALPEGHGRNVVNVILVDFRGLDTLGEIVVLSVAAIGIASLVLASRRDARHPASGPDDASTDVAGTAARPDRSAQREDVGSHR